MDANTIYEVITILTGKIKPVADSAKDKERLENMEVFLKVFSEMHEVIQYMAYKYKDSTYHSEKVIGQLCEKHLNNIVLIEK